MNILNKLSLKHQIWLGFFSVLALIILVAAISFFRLLQLQDQANRITDYSQPAMLSALSLKEDIQSTTSAMGLYIINKTTEYEKTFNQSVEKLQESIKAYKLLPAVQQDKEMQQGANRLELLINKFVSHQKKIDFLTKNLLENYPGIKIANQEINTRTQRVLQIFSGMIDSEFEESISNERRLFLQQINDLRQNWMNIVALFRTFLAIPNSSRIDQLNIFIEQHIKLMLKINSKSDIFTFEQEEGIATLNDVSEIYFSHMQSVFTLFKDEKWRADVSLIKSDISPVIKNISTQIDSMIEHQKEQVKSGNIELISKTQTSLIHIAIVLIAALVIGLIAAFISGKQIITIVNEISRSLENILQGNFSAKLNENRAGEVGKLSETINYFNQQLKNIIEGIKSSVSELHTTSTELVSVTKITTDNVLQQKKQTELVATATEEMSLTSQEVARNTASASDSSKHADSEAKVGAEKSNAAMNGIKNLLKNLSSSAGIIKELQSDTNNISVVLDVIRDISEQTNLLALNAAIEAARAGEQGRGFAVVADEVRTLASRTQDSTDQIKELIDRLQAGAKNAVNAMTSSIEEAGNNSLQVEEVVTSLSQIKDEVFNINSMLIQVASASEQQSSTAHEISNSIISISSISDKTAESTESLHSAEVELDNATHRLDNLISVFKNQSS